MKQNLVLKKAKLYISDDFLLDVEHMSDAEKEQFYKDGFTDEDFGKVHMVECEAGWIFNPMCADIVFREKIHETMVNETYDFDVDEVVIGEVHKIDDKNYSLGAIAIDEEGREFVREFLISLE